jgi:hypothetical protein
LFGARTPIELWDKQVFSGRTRREAEMTVDDCNTREAAAAILATAFVGDGDEQLRGELLDRLRTGTLPTLLRERLNGLLEEAARAFVHREVLPAVSDEPETPLLEACRRLAHGLAEQAQLIGILLDALDSCAADVCGAGRTLPIEEYRTKARTTAAIGAAIEALTRNTHPGIHQ